MTPEEQRSRMQINGIVGEIMAKKEAAKPVLTHDQECMMKAKQVSHEVMEHFKVWYKLLPMAPSKEQAFNKLGELYREGFKAWSKDDLLYVNSLAHATIIVQEISDHLA